MRYRALSSTGDYVFGRGAGAILVDVPQAVGQAIYTRLRLQFGEVFFAPDAGVPYETDIVGYGDKRDRDALIISTILDTRGVSELLTFDSLIDPITRRYGFSATVRTIYGIANVSGPDSNLPQVAFTYDGTQTYNGQQIYDGFRNITL